MLGRSRVSKLFVMRSLLLREEEAHRPELYLQPLDSEEGDGEGEGDDDAAEQQGECLVVPLVGRRRPSDAAGLGDGSVTVGGGGGVGGSRGRLGGGARVGEEVEDGGGVGSSSGDCGPGGELRYHRQLRRYREHLAQEVRDSRVCRSEREREREGGGESDSSMACFGSGVRAVGWE